MSLWYPLIQNISPASPFSPLLILTLLSYRWVGQLCYLTSYSLDLFDHFFIDSFNLNFLSPFFLVNWSQIYKFYSIQVKYFQQDTSIGIACCVSHQEALSVDYPSISDTELYHWCKWQKLLKRYIFLLVITKWPCDDTLYLSRHITQHRNGTRVSFIAGRFFTN